MGHLLHFLGTAFYRIRVFAVAGLVVFLSGCSFSDFVLLDPSGSVGTSERDVMFISVLVMLIVVLPVIFMTIYFAYKFRAANQDSIYEPRWENSHIIEAVIWVIPFAIIIVLGYITWVSTHELDPYKPLVSDKKPITVEAISLDWKWLFIYPEYNVASVSEMAFPVNTPVNFRLTSDTVMTSIMIPKLGTQIFAMAGMRSKLHLMAHEKGTYFGKNYQYSGDGFSHMTFDAIATSEKGFQQWLQKAKAARNPLDDANYKKLAKPSVNPPVKYYSSVKPNLFFDIIKKYKDGSQYHHGDEPGEHHSDDMALNEAPQD